MSTVFNNQSPLWIAATVQGVFSHIIAPTHIAAEKPSHKSTASCTADFQSATCNAPRYRQEWLHKIQHAGVLRRAELLYQQLDGLQALRRSLRPELLAEVGSCHAHRRSMTDEVLLHHGKIMVRRLRLAPGEAMPWHRDPCQRIAVVLHGDFLSIEYRDGGQSHRIQVTPGQVDWEEPFERLHRAVKVGQQPYEQVTVFLLDRPDAETQPSEE